MSTRTFIRDWKNGARSVHEEPGEQRLEHVPIVYSDAGVIVLVAGIWREVVMNPLPLRGVGGREDGP